MPTLPDAILLAEIPGADTIDLVAGGDFGPRTYAVTDPDTGLAVDLTGLTLAGWIGTALVDGEHLCNLDLDLSATPDDGTFTASLAEATIDALTVPAAGQGRIGHFCVTVSDGTTTRVLIVGPVTLRGAPPKAGS
jgi:hypothetical protein